MLDLDALFKSYLRDRQDKGEGPLLDDELQDAYRRWLDTPSEALHGVKPGQLLGRSGPQALIDSFISYHIAQLPVPVSVLDAIADSRGCEPLLRDIALGQSDDAPFDARLLAMELLAQSGSSYTLPVCLAALATPEDDDASDLALELLAARGSTIREELLAALPEATEAASERMLGLLADMPPDERVFSLLLTRFTEDAIDVGYTASLLRRYGDERARPALEASLARGRARRYADFVALKDAIEAFGGQVSVVPDFPDDPDFTRSRNAE